MLIYPYIYNENYLTSFLTQFPAKYPPWKQRCLHLLGKKSTTIESDSFFWNVKLEWDSSKRTSDEFVTNDLISQHSCCCQAKVLQKVLKKWMESQK